MKNILFLLLALAASGTLFAQQTGTFTDSRDGHVYKTIKIGNQTWMAENLAFNIDNESWPLNDDKKNIEYYGNFYKWETALTACPNGWKLPSKTDFEILINHFGDWEKAYKALTKNGSSGFDALLTGWRGSYGGYPDKDNCTMFWSATKNWKHYRWALGISKEENSASLMDDYDSRGFNIRCIKIE